MGEALIWLHEDALRMTHPVFAAAPADARILHIWDDTYLQAAQYSLKRLVFLYETLGELPIEIVRGDTLKILQQNEVESLYIPASNNPFIQHKADVIAPHKKVNIIADEPFVTLKQTRDFTRFFQYWGKAEKNAFLADGSANS